MALITPPAAGEDVRVLWRKVAECADALNALMNMTVVVDSRLKMIGKLDVGSGSSVLRIEENKEVGNLGA